MDKLLNWEYFWGPRDVKCKTANWPKKSEQNIEKAKKKKKGEFLELSFIWLQEKTS